MTKLQSLKMAAFEAPPTGGFWAPADTSLSALTHESAFMRLFSNCTTTHPDSCLTTPLGYAMCVVSVLHVRNHPISKPGMEALPAVTWRWWKLSAKTDTDVEVIREVSERIDMAIKANRAREIIIAVVLLLLFLVGLGLMIYGAAIQRWELLVPGGVTQLSIAFPVRGLIKLRGDNLRLQIIPQLLRLAATGEAKSLAFRLITRLIEQV